MAKFEMQLPTEILDDFKKIYDNSHEIFGEMTKAGADVVYSNIKAHLPAGIRDSNMMNNLMKSRVYDTPSDGGINTKVLFAGYFTNDKGVKTPAPLVANMFEYGSSKREYPKHPFLRKAFRDKNIEKAMYDAQVKASGGLLEDE